MKSGFVYLLLFFLMLAESQIAGGERGVHLTVSREGRASGEAFVEFASEEDLEKGLEKHNEHLGSRYIEGWFDELQLKIS